MAHITIGNLKYLRDDFFQYYFVTAFCIVMNGVEWYSKPKGVKCIKENQDTLPLVAKLS